MGFPWLAALSYTLSMRLYAITDATQLSPSPGVAREALIALARDWASSGIDYIQIREKGLTSRALEALAGRIMEAVKANGTENVSVQTKVLVNGRADIALAVGADGVHLPGSGALSPREVASLFAASSKTPPIISVACHSVREVEAARDAGATLVLFAPLFGKEIAGSPTESVKALAGVGLDQLRSACRAAGPMPVFALGGVNPENAASCVEAGAAGIAGIRLFQSKAFKSMAFAESDSRF
jgi:thiamine-phosphate pyrophosphorylase